LRNRFRPGSELTNRSIQAVRIDEVPLPGEPATGVVDAIEPTITTRRRLACAALDVLTGGAIGQCLPGQRTQSS